MSDSPETTSPIEANAVDDSLVCYMVTSDGRTLNLNSICGSTDRTQQSSSNAAHTRPSGNLGGLDIFGRGADAPPCFGLDDNGQPCPSSTNP
ncbi:MAG: hypothetical protein HC769_32755 [Cyanobacteria bacterium CRU_2_1]|nr:hypothetical protein [Cyanobacteria bacterium RU_5_0]NJR63134.1 hypothetical protein [Cyanobacteria bacterium CRU_2_1]